MKSILSVTAITLLSVSATYAQSAATTCSAEAMETQNSRDNRVALFACLDELTRRLESVETELAARPLLPQGAIIAYESECPPNWAPYEAADGRFILGVGQGPLESGYLLGETAGSESHALTPNELAAHSHDLRNLGLGSQLGNTNNAVSIHSSLGEITAEGTGIVGESDPHNNMPPFIALNFCFHNP